MASLMVFDLLNKCVIKKVTSKIQNGNTVGYIQNTYYGNI